MTTAQDQIKSVILNHLAASEPCTLEEILEEVRIGTGIKHQRLLPQVIVAIAELQTGYAIKEYEQCPIDDALEYAWVLAN